MDRVAVYLRYYLTLTMTFVYRQLHGVSHRFDPIVLASDVLNRDVFPYDALFVRPRSLLARAASQVRRRCGGRWSALSAAHQRDLRRTLEEQQVKLVHAHFGPYGLEILPVARALGLPLVVTFHGFGASTLLKHNNYARQLPELFEYATIVAAAQATADRLAELGAKPIVHYVGAPVNDFQFVERRPPRDKVAAGERIELVQVANLLPVKGHRYTIDAFARLLGHYPHCRLTIAGDGPLRDALEAHCRVRKVEDKVRFVGHLKKDDVIALLGRSDLFVHHSVSDGGIESATTAIVEAMATGLIPIGSTNGGIPELIDHGVDGYLVVERDGEAYDDALMKALDAGGGMGRRAAEKARARFDIDQQNEKLCDIYELALAR